MHMSVGVPNYIRTLKDILLYFSVSAYRMITIVIIFIITHFIWFRVSGPFLSLQSWTCLSVNISISIGFLVPPFVADWRVWKTGCISSFWMLLSSIISIPGYPMTASLSVWREYSLIYSYINAADCYFFLNL